MRETIDNLDFLAARVHGRRSRLAEGPRLTALCRLRTVAQLAHEVLPGRELDSGVAFQRRLLQGLAQDVASIAPQLGRSAADLLHWMLVRFQVEDLKLCLRALLAGSPLASARPYGVVLSTAGIPDSVPSAMAEAVEGLVGRVPAGPLRRSLRSAVNGVDERPRPFFVEAAMDQAYLAKLIALAGALSGEDRKLVLPLATQEADAFLLRLVARGRFVYGLPPERLRSFYVRRTAISSDRWAAMVAAPNLRAAAEYAVGRAVDGLPSESEGPGTGVGKLDPAALEVLAWNRRARLANRAFRHSHMGLAAVVAYLILRQVEVANLITLSEGLRLKVEEVERERRRIPRSYRGAFDV